MTEAGDCGSGWSTTASDSSPCQGCGACCAYSHVWPRFTLEPDADIERIPPALVSEALSGMRCDGDRCAALDGTIGIATACRIYALRPQVCRDCLPGDDACQLARRRWGLPALVADPVTR